MINEASINKEQYDNEDKSKKCDSLIRAYNEKGIFPFSLDNPSFFFSTKISSPCKKINNKKFEFSSLKKEFGHNNLNYAAFSGNKLPDFIYGYSHNQLLESSGHKDFFEYQNKIKKEINMSGKKRIRQKLDNEFVDILISKNEETLCEKEQNINLEKKKISKEYPIFVTVDDFFFDILLHIYENDKDKIEYRKENLSNLEVNNSIEKTQNIYNNINNNKRDEININEQNSCICLKSKCLNDYCRCHKNGSLCNKNCRCMGCKNLYKYINNNFSISSNKKKINHLCKCKISNCLYQYCECKKRGVFCSKDCLCSKCKNCGNNKKNNLE